MFKNEKQLEDILLLTFTIYLSASAIPRTFLVPFSFLIALSSFLLYATIKLQHEKHSKIEMLSTRGVQSKIQNVNRYLKYVKIIEFHDHL